MLSVELRLFCLGFNALNKTILSSDKFVLLNHGLSKTSKFLITGPLWGASTHRIPL